MTFYIQYEIKIDPVRITGFIVLEFNSACYSKEQENYNTIIKIIFITFETTFLLIASRVEKLIGY